MKDTTNNNISNEHSSKLPAIVSEVTPNVHKNSQDQSAATSKVHKNSRVQSESENDDNSISNNETDKSSNIIVIDEFEEKNEVIILNNSSYHKQTDASIKCGYSDENLKPCIEEVGIDKNSFGSSCVNDDGKISEITSKEYDNNETELTSEAAKYKKEIASHTNVTNEDIEIVSSGSDSDFDYSEEINTDQFDFDESNFDWKISDTPNLPMTR